MEIAIGLHIVAAVIWVGGMFFAYVVLRPVAASLLEPPHRLPLWTQTFARFFPWVWISVAVLPVTGYWMVFRLFGGMAQVPVYVNIMQGIGWVMILLYLHVFFAPYRQLRQAVARQDWPEGARRLGQIRRLIGLNLTLGLIVVVVASSGRYWHG
ncbi:MAG: hypothetical protein B7Z66_08820 [Chromatiales bacterium 21-64-14]|nr:MAG: hypothetical protein B7Z66_08820 [Chromatiales bacterium 21-64-14]HQU16116.1 CopD family protein [Gammaproteobacteria bacterium]